MMKKLLAGALSAVMMLGAAAVLPADMGIGETVTAAAADIAEPIIYTKTWGYTLDGDEAEIVEYLGSRTVTSLSIPEKIDGKTVTSFPADVDCLRAAKPVYEAYPGWSEDITGARTFEELPDNAKKYIKRLGEILQRRISMVSVGPSREQTIDVPRL